MLKMLPQLSDSSRDQGVVEVKVRYAFRMIVESFLVALQVVDPFAGRLIEIVPANVRGY